MIKTVDTYQETITTSELLVKRIKVALKSLEKDKFTYFGSRDIAAVKRTSMELTRLLVQIRKPFMP